MASHSEAATVGLLRDSIPFRRLPWIRPLVEAIVSDYGSVAPFFQGNPSSPDDWRAKIARVQQQPRDRDAVAAMLHAQLTRRSAPEAARTAAADLANPSTVAVVTGQQAGLLGGPLYTLLKAVTTIQLARDARQRYGVPVVPVFWVDADDHDWDEIRPIHLLNREHALTTITADSVEGAGNRPIGTLAFDDRISQTLADVEAQLAPTEFTASVIDVLRAHYRPGASPATAFAGWLDALLGAHGLVVFDASDPAAKRLAARVFQHELAHPCRSAHLARETSDAMTAAGHAAQIVPADDVVCMFRVDDNGRAAVRYRDGQFTVGDRQIAVDALRAEAAEHPERFSPNVLLRPIVQDTLFPTVCYVAGPSELAYHGELGRIYEAFGVEAPLVTSRASATLVDGAAVRFFDRYELPLEDLQPHGEAALNRLLERQFPASVDAAFVDVERHIAESAQQLAAAATAVDPTLAGAAETTVARMRDTVKSLQNKIVQASKKKDETLRRQFVRTQALTFPNGHPQERLLNVAFFANRYGLEIGSRLIDLLPPSADHHYVVVP